MRILFLWHGDFPWDVRVEKVCKSLIGAGHTIHLVCSNGRGEPEEAIWEGIHVHRLPYFHPLPVAVNRALAVPLLNPRWLAHLYRIMRRTRCQMVFVRDLPLAPEAALVAKAFGVSCVYDMAECYPEMYRSVLQIDGFRFRNLLFRNVRLAEILEGWSVRWCDRVLVMVEESRQRLVAKGVPAHKIELVSNTPLMERYQALEGSKRDRPLTVIYQGLLSPGRGLQTVIDAVALCVSEGRGMRLVVVGKGHAEEALRSQVKRLSLESAVEFRGWVDNRAIPEMIAEADVGIVPHYRTPHSDHTIPNKLFDYMAAGKPVVVSDARPLQRIVAECHAGLSYPDRDAVALARAFTMLMDPKVREHYGKNARSAVESEYNWSVDESRLLRSVDALGRYRAA